MNPPPQPQVRASHSRGTLKALERLEPARLPDIMARLPEEARRGLAEAARSDRIPAAWDLALVRAEVDSLGRERMRRVARATMLDALGGPLLGSLVTSALRLFGTSPAALFGWTGRAWDHVTLGCGTLRLERSDVGEACLLLEGLPAGLADREYLEAIAGTLEAVLALCRVVGEVVVEPRPGGARFRASWRVPR
jgi:hypothetical protein